MINHTDDKDFFGTITGIAHVDSQVIDLLYVLKDETTKNAVSILYLAIDTLFQHSDPVRSGQKVNELITIN